MLEYRLFFPTTYQYFAVVILSTTDIGRSFWSWRLAYTTCGGVCRCSWPLLTLTFSLSSSLSMHRVSPTLGAPRKRIIIIIFVVAYVFFLTFSFLGDKSVLFKVHVPFYKVILRKVHLILQELGVGQGSAKISFFS